MANNLHLPASFNSLVLFAVLFLISCFLSMSSVYGARHLAVPETTATTSNKGPKGQFKSTGASESPFSQEKVDYHLPGIPSPDESIPGHGSILPLREDTDGDFFVTVGFGIPSRDFTLFFDTGSSLTWVQCQPCSGDCNVQGQFFEPSNSSTYSNATCDPTCDYKMDYNDGSYSKGSYIRDTLSLSTKGALEGFVFGCAQTINGRFGGADGLLGIGAGKYSLMAQSSIQYFSIFCYCLPATQSSTGFLALGFTVLEIFKNDLNQQIPLAVTTEEDKYTSYYVHLLGISIGQQRTNIPSSSKTIIDSGTLFSQLTPSVYSALSSAFREIMSGYPPAPPMDVFDTCYKLGDQNNWTPPKMMLHFENSIDVNLHPSAVAISMNDSRVCLAFIANEKDDAVNIIGNQQHREKRVFYDIGNAKLAFATGGCTA